MKSLTSEFLNWISLDEGIPFYFCTDLSCSETSLNRSMKIFHHFPPVTSLINPLSNFFLERPPNTAFQSFSGIFSLRSLNFKANIQSLLQSINRLGVKHFPKVYKTSFIAFDTFVLRRVSQMSMWKSLGHYYPFLVLCLLRA